MGNNNLDSGCPTHRPDFVVGEEPLIQFPPTPQVKKSGSGFSRNILSLGGGSVIAQVIGVLAMPVVARLFLPEAFGIAALFLSFSIILGCVATLRYEFAIVLPKEDAGAANILLLCFLNAVLVSLFTALLIAILGARLLKAFNAPGLIPYQWLFPVSVFLAGISHALRYWNTRNRYFYRLGISRAAEAAVKDLGLIGGGLAGLTSGGHMIVARLIGETVSPAIFGIALFRHDLKFIIHNCSWSRIRDWAKRYRRFPLIDFWTALVQTFSVQVPVLVLMKFFGPQDAGLFSQSLLLLCLPTSLIGASLSQVTFQRFADHHASGKDISGIAGSLYRHLFSLGFLPLALVVVIGPDIFQTALGRNWVESGVYARMLAPWIFINFLYSPLSSVIYVLEKQHADLIFSITLITGRLGALLLGVYLWGEIRPVVLFYGLVNLVIYLSVTIYVLRCARIALGRVLEHALRVTLIASPFLAATVVAKWWLGIGGPGLLIAGFLSCLIYLALTIAVDPQLRDVFGRLVGDRAGNRPGRRQ